MNRIRLLSEQVANQIAAGEVVDRPASVVKELVENSLDAGATRVSVEIQAGGRSLVRVTDDGVGMNRDDALLSLERHATSKIRRAEDLAAVVTMGFRGEALPSIASVSRFTLTTREHPAAAEAAFPGDSDRVNPELQSAAAEGTQIIVAGGKIHEVRAAGCAPGTSVEVRQLFFNLPARRKFLRSEETESAHVQHYLLLAALSYPEAGFTFQKDGRVVWQLAAVKTGLDIPSRLSALGERMRALYGGEQKLVPIHFQARYNDPGTDEDAPSQIPNPKSQILLWGFIGAPGVSRATREDQHLFVNRRPVENRGLNFALLEGYHTSLMKGRYPVCCLFLEIDPAAVDVNIHPAKREVKFHREGEVRRIVAQAVREGLLGYHASDPAPQATSARKTDERPELGRAAAEATQTALPNLSAPLGPYPTPQPAGPDQPVLKMGFGKGTIENKTFNIQHSTPGPQRQRSAEEHRTSNIEHRTSNSAPSTLDPRPSTALMPLLNVPLRLVGVVGKLYVVLESDRGLVLLDQHAAHERILFEQMLNRLEQQEQAPSQKLLLPETVELAGRDALFLREQLETLTRLGVGLSEFGERTFLLDALPPFVKVPDARQFVLELIDQLKAAGEEVNSIRLGEHVVAKTVCRHAVKANDPLAGLELENLVEDLRGCAMPYTCPHGRPTLIEMNYRELEKKFGRAQ